MKTCIFLAENIVVCFLNNGHNGSKTGFVKVAHAFYEANMKKKIILFILTLKNLNVIKFCTEFKNLSSAQIAGLAKLSLLYFNSTQPPTHLGYFHNSFLSFVDFVNFVNFVG